MKLIANRVAEKDIPLKSAIASTTRQRTRRRNEFTHLRDANHNPTRQRATPTGFHTVSLADASGCDFTMLASQGCACNINNLPEGQNKMFELNDSDKIRTIQFAHGKVNAMDLEFCQGLSKQLDDAEASDCNAVIIEGNGRVFSAGVELKRLIGEDLNYFESFIVALESVFEKLFLFSKPLVGNINGHAIAGGCVMACCSDAKITHSRAKIGVPELRVGVPFPSLGLEIMRFGTAPRFFRPMINIGATYAGDKALEAGVADEVVEPEKLHDRALEIARELTLVPAQVFSLTKKQLRIPAMRNLESSEQQFRDQILALWRSDEVRENIRQYVEANLK